MALYLTRFSYTPETWARLSQKPEDRRDAAREYIEAVGGKLHGFWYAFGEYDAYSLLEAPDNVSIAAVAMAISGGGALSKYETTVLLTVEETMDAMRKAGDIKYRPPGT
jgi:uncharacterized protein with GYD domain